MKETITAEQWVYENVSITTLIDSIVSSLREAIAQENCEDGTYTALVYDIVSGSAGQYAPAYALKFFNYDGIDTDNLDNIEDVEFIHDELESYAGKVASVLNNLLPSEINVGFGYWESDGTYCLMAYLDEQEYLNHKDESHNFISEAFGDLGDE
jgi:hypothetical protein